MRIFRSATQAALSALISGGAFGSMLILFLLSPTSDEPVSIEDGSSHEAIYVADVAALMASLAAEEAIALDAAEPDEIESQEPTPEPESQPTPAPSPAAEAASEPVSAAMPTSPAARPSPQGRQIAEVHRARREAAAAAAEAKRGTASKRKRN